MDGAHRPNASLGWLLALAASLAAAGCTGQLGEAGTEGDVSPGEAGGDGDGNDVHSDGTTPLTFSCDPERPTSASPLRRLSRAEYEGTLRTLAEGFVGDLAPEVLDATAIPLLVLPLDAAAEHARLDTAVTQAHIDGQHEVARAFAAAVTASDTHLERLLGACATDGDSTNDHTCLGDFVSRFGEHALRRPLSAEEHAFFLSEVADPERAAVDPANVRDVVAVMLLSPSFVYHVEDGADATEDDADLFPLTGHEIAARLSYLFWASPPDEALLEAARSGRLEDPATYELEVRRVFEDPRTEVALDELFRGWFHLGEVPPLDVAVGTPAYDAFAGENRPTPELRDAMIREVLDLARAARGGDASFDDLFLSDVSYATTDDLAAIYGVATWSPGQPEVRFPEGQRSGLLSRAAMVATSLVSTRPIHKGVTIRREILCDELGDPPADMGEPPEIDPISTAREKTEALTMQPASSCSGCHRSINPLGYATESFDALGRHRTHERLFDEAGNEIASLPIDTSGVPYVLTSDDGDVAGPVELGEVVVDSGKPQACFARNYFRFATGRPEDLEADGCALEAVREQVADGGSLREALVVLALEPGFRMRRRVGP
jgi:hypothetical protein